MPKTPQSKAPNLLRVEDSLVGSEIESLNGLHDGLGNKLHKLISQLGSAHSAQAGYAGPVALAQQSKKDKKGNTLPAVQLSNDRIGGAQDPIYDQDVVNLRSMRNAISSAIDANNKQMSDSGGIPGTPGAPGTRGGRGPGGTGGGGHHGGGGTGGGTSPGCSTVQLSNGFTYRSDFNKIYSVIAASEYIYVAGETTLPKFEVLRIDGNDASIKFLGYLNTSEGFLHMVLKGHYIFGCGLPSGASPTLTIIDVKDPYFPRQLPTFNDVNDLASLHVQGHYVFAVSDVGVKVIDVGTPSAPTIVGVAVA